VSNVDRIIEKTIISAFIVKRKQERALFELASSKKRDRFMWRLSDVTMFKEACMFEIEEPIPSHDIVYNLLKSKGAPSDCYCMKIKSNDLDFDGNVISLEKAISSLIGYGPFLISCLHGKLAYLECEQSYGAPSRYILINTSLN